jgi:ABC-type uncharacterized transport system involved in gliding motility auxiliary subunit
MKTILKKKLWKYLFWVSPFLVAAGLSVGLVSGNWGAVPLLLVIIGIVFIGLWLGWESQQSHWWERRSTQVGTNALLATLAILAILGLLNFLGTRYHFRTDLTETQLFTLAPQSRELVHSLKQPVKLWIFEGAQNPLDRELLENYQRQSSKFKFEYVDPQARPGLAEKFGVKDRGEVYLESQDRRLLVQVLNDNERLSEVRLTNRLQQITSATQPKVYFLQGHGEHQITTGENAISQAVQALGDKNYKTSGLNLTENATVLQDAAVVVIAGPKRALFESEVTALRDYLNRGGNLLLMVDPNTDPKLDSLLADWGVKLDNRLAVDVAGIQELGPAVPVVTEYGKHPITKDFKNGISFYPLARAVDTQPVAGLQATPLLLTKPYPKSWAESDLKSEKLEFHPGRDRKGPLTLGVALSRKLSPKANPLPSISATSNPTPTSKPKTLSSPTLSPLPTSKPITQTKVPATPSQNATESRMVVVGNSDFATDGLFGQQLNGDVFLNSVTWLSQQDQQLLSIRPKEAKNRRINLTTAQGQLLELLSLFVLPLIGLIAASVLWWRRK